MYTKKILAVLLLLVFCPLAFAQGKPKIAVYVTGATDPGTNKALMTRILSDLVSGGRYQAVERSEEFLARLSEEHVKQRSGAIDDDQIKRLGRQFGVDFICIADITSVLGSYLVSARIVDVESAAVVVMGDAESGLKTLADLSEVSRLVVGQMFGEHWRARGTAQRSAPPPPPPPQQQMYAPPPQQQPPVYAQHPQQPAYAPPPQQYGSERRKTEGRRLSMGAGVFYEGDYGGGARLTGTDIAIGMPYSGVGAYVYVDVVYADIFFGYSGGGAKWEAIEFEPTDELGDMRRSYLNIGAYLKAPVGDGALRGFPIFGIEYEAFMGGKLEFTSQADIDFSDESDEGLSALWFKAGFGLDYDLTKSVYLRAQFLYGIRTPNGYETEDLADDEWEVRIGHGLTVRVGVGVKF